MIPLHFVERLKLRRPVVGVTYLLGKVYVVIEKSADVLISDDHCCKKVPICGMIPVDIAVNYSEVSVNVLDDGNGCIWSICQDHTVEKVVDLARRNLLSMSLTPDGRLTVIQNNSDILLYEEIREVRNEQETKERKSAESEKAAEDKDGKTKDEQEPNKVVRFEKVVHAVQVAPEMVVCDGTKIARITSEGEVLRETEGTGCTYITVDRNGNIIVCNQSDNQVFMLDSKTLERKSTLLTLDRDGIESPRHVHCGLENSLLLVGWRNFVDIFSFTEDTARGYLSAAEQEARDKRTHKVTNLETDVTQSEAYEQTCAVCSLHHQETSVATLANGMTLLLF